MAQQSTRQPVESLAEETTAESRFVRKTWTSAILGGLAGGIAFGLLMQQQEMLPTVASLYGLDGVAWGWVAHLFHSVVFALVFAAVLTGTSLRRYADRVVPTTALGAAYGVLLWILAAAVVMPFWLGEMGLDAPTIPNLEAMSFVGHLGYGVVLGAVFVLAYRR